MYNFKPDKNISVRKVRIPVDGGSISALVLAPKSGAQGATGVLWLHGGGYIAGMKEMVYMSRAVDLVKRYGAVVVAPGYRTAFFKPYPAAVLDCYASLLWLRQNAAALGVRDDQLMVGGESAGGGLCAAVCAMARDRGEVRVAFQMPLYPMLDDRDTDSSRNNHGKVWDTRKNHFAWRVYLRGVRGDVPPYAAPARLTDYRGLPPAYTFVGDGEPFYCETVQYVKNLRACGISAGLDVYHCDTHAFDMMRPEWPMSREAAEKFNAEFARAQREYFAAQGK
ncbi:alpha/beta hydrolase [Gemmiger sp.]